MNTQHHVVDPYHWDSKPNLHQYTLRFEYFPCPHKLLLSWSLFDILENVNHSIPMVNATIKHKLTNNSN